MAAFGRHVPPRYKILSLDSSLCPHRTRPSYDKLVNVVRVVSVVIVVAMPFVDSWGS